MDTNFIRENKPCDVSPSSQAWFTDKLNQALDEYDVLKASRDKLVEALQKIDNWAKAYPLDVFSKPDLKKAHKVLKEAGMTLDAISADAMRHVLDGVKEIVEQALKEAGKL